MINSKTIKTGLKIAAMYYAARRLGLIDEVVELKEQATSFLSEVVKNEIKK